MKTLITLLVASAIAIPFSSSAQTWVSGTSAVTTTGFVGIGTTSPTSPLHVIKNTGFGAWKDNVRIDNYQTTGIPNAGNVLSIYNTPLTVPASPSSLLFAVSTSQTIIPNSLRIGATAATSPYNTYALSVDGSIIAKRCVIQVSNWADFVFNKNYSLPELSDVKMYVQQNSHLPGVPSESEIKANGVEVGEMNKILMQKIEELTLYMIQLQEKNSDLSSRLETLEKH